MLNVNAELPDGYDAIEALITKLEQAVISASDEAMTRAADRARSDHVFISRTGTLENSIAPIRMSGSFAADTLEAGIEATAEYSPYVIAKTGDDFLQRALDSEMADLESAIETAIAQALE